MNRLILLLLLSVAGFVSNAQILRPAGNATVNTTGWYNIGFTRDSAKIFILHDTFPARYPSVVWHPDGNFYKTLGGVGAFWSLWIPNTPSSGTVTSVGITGSNGIGVSNSPITVSGNIGLTLGNITPTTVNSGAITGTNFYGSGKALTGVLTDARAGAGITVSANGGVFTITNSSPSSGGTVTSVSASLPLSVTNPTTTPNITIDTTNSVYGMTTLYENSLKVNKQSKIVYVKDYGDDFAAVQSAVRNGGDSAVIVFTPGVVYTQNDFLRIRPYQTWQMNGATLKRYAEPVVTLTTASGALSNTIIVSSVPSTWHVNDHIYIYVDTSSTGGLVDTRIISNISGNTITIFDTLGNAAYNNATSYAIGSKVKKVYQQVTTFDSTVIPEITGVSNSDIYPFTILNGIFDGNKSQTGGNVSWYVNSIAQVLGERRALFDNVKFKNVPNDCIVGHGFNITNSFVHNANNSFVHISGVFKNPFSGESLKNTIGIKVENNLTDSTNLFPSEGVTGSRHSRGVIESSASGGFINIVGNRFSNGRDAVYGNLIDIAATSDPYQYATRNIVISGNYFRNFNKAFYNFDPAVVSTPFSKLGNIVVSGNIYDSCRTTTWPPYDSTAYNFVDSMVIGNNVLINGTVWNVPLRFRDLTNIINQTTEVQQGGLNVSGSVSSNTITTTGLDNYQSDISSTFASLSKITKGYADARYAPISVTNYLTPFSGTSLTSVSPYTNFSVTGTVTSNVLSSLTVLSNDITVRPSGSDAGVKVRDASYINSVYPHGFIASPLNSNRVSVQVSNAPSTGTYVSVFTNLNSTNLDTSKINFIQAASGTPWTGSLLPTTMTGSRQWLLPNTSGTIALTSDIPSVTGYVPYSGAVTDLNLGTHNYVSTGTITTTNSMTANKYLVSGTSSMGTTGSLGYNSSAGTYITSQSGSGSDFQVNNASGTAIITGYNNLDFVVNGGNMGIGLTPTAKLTVGGNVVVSGNLTTTGNIQAASITSTGSSYFATGSGNVGIGTTSPVFNGTSNKYVLLDGGSGVVGEFGAGGNITNINSAIGTFSFVNTNLGTSDKRNAVILGRNAGATNSGQIEIYVANAGTLNQSMQLNKNQTIQFNGYGAGTLTTDASGNITATSDGRLKYDQGTFKNALGRIMKLNGGHYYKWKPQSGMETNGTYFSLFANEVHSVLGESFAPTQKDGYYGLADRALLSLTIQALQEEKKEKDAQIKSLSDRLDKLEKILLNKK